MRTPIDIIDLQPTVTPELEPALWYEGEIVWRGEPYPSADRCAERAMAKRLSLMNERCHDCSATGDVVEVVDGELVVWCSLACHKAFHDGPWTRIR